MKTALELVTAALPAVRLLKMTWLTLKAFLATCTRLGNQKGALWTGHVDAMTAVLDGRMAAFRTSLTVETTLGRLRSARLWRLQHRSSAVAADLVEDGFEAARAGAAMAHLLAIVAAAL